MSFNQIAKTLHIDAKTAKKAPSLVIPESALADIRDLYDQKENNMYPFTLYNLFNPKPKHIWAQVRILRETDKAIFVDNGLKTWIPKSCISGIRLRNNTFEIYVREDMIG